MDFSFQPEITKELLLEHNNEETYMAFYLGIPVKKGLFISPLRVDHKPTCSFYKGRRRSIFQESAGSLIQIDLAGVQTDRVFLLCIHADQGI